MNLRALLVLLAFLFFSLFCWWYYIYQIKQPGMLQASEVTNSDTYVDTTQIFTPGESSLANYFAKIKQNTGSDKLAIFSLKQLKGETEEEYQKRYLNFEKIANKYLLSDSYKIVNDGIEDNLDAYSASAPSFSVSYEDISNNDSGSDSNSEGNSSNNQDYTIPTNKAMSSNWPLTRIVKFNSNNEIDTRRKTKHYLARLVNAMKDDTSSIVLRGRTDQSGTEEKGLIRAEILKNFLISQGISSDRIEITSFGQNCPLASNMTSEGRKINNCVEICKK